MAISITAIPLDTLSRKVGEALARAGEQLLRHGAVRIARVDDQSAQVAVSGEGYGATTVTVTVDPDNRGIPFTFACRCFKAFGKDQVWCEHKYAAALALVRYAEQGSLGNWQGHLSWLLADFTAARLPAPPPVTVLEERLSPTFLVLFSLQRQTGGQVMLAPLVVPVSRVPADALQDIEHLAEVVDQARSKLAPQPMPLASRPATFAPATPEGQAAMAALFAHPAVAGKSVIPADTLYDLLPLLEHALVYLGTASNALKRRLRVVPEPGMLQLQLAESPAGLTLTPEISLPDATVPVCKEKLYVLSAETACCLSDDLLFTVPVPAPALRALAAQPCPEIPAEDKDDFVRRYLASLAGAFPLQGEGLSSRECRVPPVPQLYLEEKIGGVKLRFRFAYQDWEYPRAHAGASPDRLEVDPNTAVLYRVTRDFTAEAAALETLRDAGIVPCEFGDRADFTCEASLARLLCDILPDLRARGFQVIGEEGLRSIRVLRDAPEFKLKVSTKIDWFDLSGVLQIGELKLSLQELRRGLRARDGAITCPDGTLVIFPPEWWRSLRFLLGMTVEEGKALRVPRRQAMAFNLALTEFDGVKADAEFKACRERLRAFSEIAKRPLPAGFTGALRPYQQAGYEWLHFLHEYGLGGCLADDMGLGKTVQTLVFLQSLRESGHARHADLIVMPRSLLFNWQREVERFAPSFRILVHADNDRPQDHTDFDGYDLVLTTYGVMLRDLEVLRSYPFHYVILDEAQAIKNPQTQTSRAAGCLNADHRLTLTGTPVENGAIELWSQFHFLEPGLLGTQDYFREEFSLPIEKQGDAGAARFLQRLVYPFILRRTKEQAAPDLPPRTERQIYNAMEPAQRALYEKTRDMYRERLLGLMADEGLGRSRMHILEGLLRLRQLCLHPRLVNAEYTEESAKLLQTLDTLETLHAGGHKALIFSQFAGMLAIVREALDERGLRYAYLDGKTKDRQARVDAFQQDPELPFFLISLKAGGTGLNLTAADYVLHLDPWWNPAVEQQATDRTHRIGQQNPVFVYKFITLNSVEEKIVQLQERKRALTEQLVTTEGGVFKSLTAEDLAELFS
ncbi:MAG: SNF2-related protein [Armatimonadota bacterium]